MTFEEKLKTFRDYYATTLQLGGIQGLLGWDQLTYMPVGAMQSRGEQLQALGGIIYDRSTSPEYGQLIADLVAEIPDLDADEPTARELKLAKRNYEQSTKVPKDKMMELIMTTSVAQGVWQRAKEENDFAAFQPHLQKILELNLELVEYFKPYDHPYDALADQFEPGLKTARVKEIFGALRPRQVELIQAIGERPQPETDFLFKRYPLDLQRKINQYFATKQGFDWTRGRLDESAHPFTTNFGMDDVRLTTNYDEFNAMDALFSTMHEAGHGLYELGISKAYKGTTIGGTSSMALHESQSRLWENLVGRSKAFWSHFYPTLQAFFSENLANVSLDAFYKAINKVSPSLIRTEADEATYNLHIMLRFEIELGMIEGQIATKDLPEIWNEKMRDYLGVVPSNDTTGVLQDVHWSGGMIGYFPSYAIGNLIASQWWHQLIKDQPNTIDEIASGNLANILAWLREKVHQHGSRYDSMELVKRVTGEPLNPDYYMNYLTEKYSEIYEL